jgi:glyoxylase-like metal-dependent hydrolase (beta-lactamase superfamily II)
MVIKWNRVILFADLNEVQECHCEGLTHLERSQINHLKEDNIMEINPNVHVIPGITANPYLLVDQAGLTLIDAGLPGSDKKIISYLKKLGYQAGDLKRIIITHADFDHVGGLAALVKASGAKVLASPLEAAAMAEGHPSRAIKPTNNLMKFIFKLLTLFGSTAKVQADELLSDGQLLPILGGLKVVDTHGHTPGHISLFLLAGGILFSGDSIVSDAGRLYPSREAVTWDRNKADESVRRQAGLGAKIVCPGHGPVIMEAQDKFPTV